MFDEVFRHACLLVLIISGIPLAASAMSGLLVSILQASTQVQEQSISYVVKLTAAGISLFFLWNWAALELKEFIQHGLNAFIELGRI